LTERELSEFAIERLSLAVQHEPHEFIFSYMLADHLNRLGRLVPAFRSATCSRQIAPSDPRAAFALGSVLRLLTQARYSEPECAGAAQLRSLFFEQIGESFDPDAAHCALADLGLSLDDAIEGAFEAFRETLRIGVVQARRTSSPSVSTPCMTSLASRDETQSCNRYAQMGS